MYTQIPKRERRQLKAALATAWLLTGAGGIAAMLVSPLTIVAELGIYLVVMCGVVVAVSAVTAALGVLLERYRWEWWASWFAAAGIIPYLGTVWWIIGTGETTRLTQGFLVAALAAFFVTRALQCSAHAAKLRVLHEGAVRPDDG